jgi:Ca-activated chloride channel homolog
MDRQISSTKTKIVPALLFFIAMICANVLFSWAESLAAKNKKGNELYQQGKYADAEKKYLDAQVNTPGNPSVLYNLGNSLIKQNKNDEGVKALNQAIDKGDKTTKENSWYNKGNALFSMERFKESSEAFIQALRLNSADKDAKNNLELALMKLKQKENKSKQSDSPKQERKKSDQKQQEGGKEQSSNEKNEPAKQQIQQQPQRTNTVNKDKALQILDAIQNQEKDEKRKLLERRALQQSNGKDW